MKRNQLRFFILFILISSMFFGISAVSVTANSQLKTSAIIKATDNTTLTVVVGNPATHKAWGPTTWEFSLVSSWMVGGQGGSSKGDSLEKLWEIRTIPVYPYTEYRPTLATGYDIVSMWPEEPNSKGWNNTGGIRVMNITLRENVKFQDGSEWNATVAKWNIDRAYVLTGNLTGTEGAGHSDIMGHMTYKAGLNYEDFYTTTWNHSYTYSDDPVSGAPLAPQYYGKNNDPNESWTTVTNTYIQDGHYPIINKTIIVKTADQTASGTGGIIQLEFNDFVTDLRLVAWFAMISMEHYSDLGGEDYFYKQITDTGDWTGDDLACGTGVMKAIEVDKVNNIMRMERNNDYWNFTEMRAAGKMIVEEGLISYLPGDTDGQLVTTALTSGDGDFSFDGPPSGILFEDQLKTSPILNWTEYSPQLDNIEQLDFIQENTDVTFRKAISFAFNYTAYFANVLTDRSYRCDNLMGEQSVYLDDSIVGSYFDLTIARNALLNDPTYGSVLSYEAGITGSSSDQDWLDFAADVGNFNATSEELFTLNLFHSIYTVDFVSSLETSLAHIGMVLNKSGATPSNEYGDWKTLDIWWGMWFVMLNPALRQDLYDKDLEAFYVTWPMPVTDLGYLDAFYSYTYQWMNATGGYENPTEWGLIPDTWNWGLINDPELQVLLRALYFQDEAGRFETYSDIQNRTATETFPSMFISQIQAAYVLNKKFEIDWDAWGGWSFSEIMIGDGYESAGIPVEIIPGFPLIALIGVVGISILAIGMKKRKKFK